jgi:hypothetical protein
MLSLFAATAHLKLLKLINAILILPFLITGMWFTSGQAYGGAAKKAEPVKAREASRVKPQISREELALRRLRVQRVLVTLDRVAEAALKMAPERAQALEPVILDIAEQTMAIKTDAELEQIETTVSRLVHALGRMVEPEMSL